MVCPDVIRFSFIWLVTGESLVAMWPTFGHPHPIATSTINVDPIIQPNPLSSITKNCNQTFHSHFHMATKLSGVPEKFIPRNSFVCVWVSMENWGSFVIIWYLNRELSKVNVPVWLGLLVINDILWGYILQSFCLLPLIFGGLQHVSLKQNLIGSVETF